MKIALIGYGKMGRMIEQIAVERGHEIVCIIDVDNQHDFESEAFHSADVAIEFTAPQVAYNNYVKAWKAGVKVVSGSTGWLKEHGEEVQRACAEEGKTLFWASNFSVGVAVFSAVNKCLARIMNDFPQYAASIEETHHVHKLDFPSGTAITLAEDLMKEAPRYKSYVANLEEPPMSDEAVVPITSYRRGEVPGIHSIVWDSEADKITITHDAHSRKGFALGAVLAAEYTAKHSGLLTMNDLFKF